MEGGNMEVQIELRYRLMDMRIGIERDPSEDPSSSLLRVEWLPEQGAPEASLAIVGRPADLRAFAARVLELLGPA
jgi:hypothetical protein